MADPVGMGRLFIRFSLMMGLKKPPQVAPKNPNLKRSEEILDFKKLWPGKKKAQSETAKPDRDTVGESRVHDKNQDKE